MSRRTIATKWRCQHDGACCREFREVVVSADEMRLLTEAAPTVELTFREVAPNFYAMQTGPCPLLSAEGLCSVYEVRPYNCRRFMCLRPDVTVEPWETGPNGECLNATERLDQSLHALEFYRTNQRFARKGWAEAHGWDRILS